jgi:hypothetical protein
LHFYILNIGIEIYLRNLGKSIVYTLAKLLRKIHSTGEGGEGRTMKTPVISGVYEIAVGTCNTIACVADADTIAPESVDVEISHDSIPPSSKGIALGSFGSEYHAFFCDKFGMVA